MTTRILCPGPSLARYQADDFAGVVIGVNRAAVAHCCDYWVAGDDLAVAKIGQNVLGRPLLFTTGDVLGQIRDGRLAWTGQVRRWEELYEELPPSPPAWTLFSLTAAIALAAWLRFDRIEIFGCDWTIAGDFDGDVSTISGRSEQRWAHERERYDALCVRLAARGVSVIRILK